MTHHSTEGRTPKFALTQVGARNMSANNDGDKTVQIQVQPNTDTLRLYHIDLSNASCPIDLCLLNGTAGSFRVRTGTKLRRLKESWFKSLNSPLAELKEQWMDLLEFTAHDGTPIRDSDTAGSLLLEDFTVVHVKSRRSSPELSLEERQVFQLSQDISSTRHQEEFQDIAFHVQGDAEGDVVELRANRMLCCARSSHLKMQLQSGVDVLEFRHHAAKPFDAMLGFLYTGKVEIPTGSETEMLAIADEFCLDAMKELCEERLVGLLSSKTVIQYLHVAHRHECEGLQQAALEHIVSNFAELKSMPSYKELTQDLLTLVVEHTIESRMGGTTPQKRRKMDQCHEVSFEVKEEQS